MKTIIAGSRHITDYDLLCRCVKASGFEITEVVSGMARGVDTLGVRYAKEHNLPLVCFPADWQKYGKSAGPRRNLEMARYADALIAITLDNSRGTQDMIWRAQGLGLKYRVYDAEGNLLEKLF